MSLHYWNTKMERTAAVHMVNLNTQLMQELDSVSSSSLSVSSISLSSSSSSSSEENDEQFTVIIQFNHQSLLYSRVLFGPVFDESIHFAGAYK
jgi:hypothetical protein